MQRATSTNQARPSPKSLQKPTKNPKKKGKRRNNNRRKTTLEDSLNVIDWAKVYDIKTPVSILLEILDRLETTPVYELVGIEGAHHEPIFKYRVWFNEKCAIGTGKSKKEARHSAAKKLIEKLRRPETEKSTTLDDNIDDLNSSLGSNVFGNPIGWIQELCTARRWPPPMYDIELVLGLPHEPQFTIACVVSKYREVGQGKSKQIAKRSAAHKMWIKIHKNAETSSVDTNEVNYIQLLQEIAIEYQIEVKYGHIDDKTVAGHFRCLVQLSTVPVVISQGIGTTAEDAQANAAYSVLEYLKIGDRQLTGKIKSGR